MDRLIEALVFYSISSVLKMQIYMVFVTWRYYVIHHFIRESRVLKPVIAVFSSCRMVINR